MLAIEISSSTSSKYLQKSKPNGMMNNLYIQGIKKASEIRLKLGYDLYQPLNIYDVCEKLGVDVQFVDVNMEGFYISKLDFNRILISNKRPFARRVFTCGHELGHHVFNHGLKLDILNDDTSSNQYKDDDEKLVDTFSANLLMPIAGVESEFLKRNINPSTASPLDFYIISSVFGVGYQSLVTHCKINRLINEFKSMELSKLTPSKIFENEFGNVGEKSHFKIIDGLSDPMPVDLEISNYLILPEGFIIDDDFLEKKINTKTVSIFSAKKTGITSISSASGDISYFVRIQPKDYVGFATYRHLEN